MSAGVAELARRPLPEDVFAASVNAILNVVGTSIGASQYAAVDVVVRTALEHGTPGQSPVPGRPERVDLTSAALATGLAAHLDDFDDTHLATVVPDGHRVGGIGDRRRLVGYLAVRPGPGFPGP